MTTRKPRIGPWMAEALRIVRRNPGILQSHVAASVGPHGSVGYGTATVKRAVAAGLLAYFADCRAAGCDAPRSTHRHLYAVDVDVQ